jgi:hypothetical protein
MKTGFKDPIAVKVKEKRVQSGWNFDAPEYDRRTSEFISAGTDYGVGHRSPVGREGNPLQKVPTLPWGRVETEKLYERKAKKVIREDEEN